MNKLLLVFIFSSLLLSCSTQYGRYQQKNDSTPTRLPHPSELKDAVPRIEAKSKGGNKSTYQVRGKSYQVLDSAEGFSQHGIASWYGKKFHGHLTSNGEIYNMYGMSAAHKNLPLPTYVRVTNKDNQKSVIVRVNDRGPFHQSRIIDLSYSAAYKLDMLKTGTAKVLVEAITHTKSNKQAQRIKTQEKNKTKESSHYLIQVFATSNHQLAVKTAQAIKTLYQLPSQAKEKNGIFRVQIGPILQIKEVNDILATLKINGYPNAFKLTL